ncbi:multidrug effflux MFS transporter [Hufsiella ginkgonis]|uniref:Bcr/CflA family efflux MFS transporter n=1 Tax=Hufsiella ginkgonis TaxID=2695274 RepID=A0A7K1XW54_9SPHI|nr:multidrug effflux MFS transporter [Hufsiella ginkgonis]MXV14756.1 Bcr/CflA family efflux MFS transporter [Hufsiella ginkgonis]
MTKKRYYFLVFILGTLTALSPFSIDMYLPGFPVIAEDLHTTVASVSLSLSSYFVGIAAGQLLYGPLLDRFGRKKPLYAGLLIYIAASAACMTAHSIGALIAWRLVQAVGGCAASVTAVAMVRDLFPVKDNAKVFSLLMLVVGTSPMIAPTAGGYLITAYGWHSVFILLLVICALILAAAALWLPESYAPDPAFSLKPGPILSGFLSVLKEPAFYTYAFSGAIAFAGLFVYVSGSPMVFMDIFSVSPKTYGIIFAVLSIGFIGSGQVNTLLLRKYTSEQLIFGALAVQLVVAIVFLAGTMAGWYGLEATLVLLFFYLFCVGFTFPNASALAMSPFTKNAGSASALLGCLQMAFGAFASAMVGLFDVRSAVPMVAIMLGTSLAAFVILATGRKKIKSLSLGVSDQPSPYVH